MIVKVDEDNFSIKLYRDFVKGKLVGLMEVIPIDELLEVWEKHKAEPTISKMEQIDKDINVRSKDEPQTDCHKLINEVVKLDMSREDKFKVMELLEKHCEKCKHYLFTDIDGHYCEHETYGQPCSYEPKDEPQKDTEIAKAIVHKMIADAVIAEDAYPDLRQKMHDAVDEYEPQTGGNE